MYRDRGPGTGTRQVNKNTRTKPKEPPAGVTHPYRASQRYRIQVTPPACALCPCRLLATWVRLKILRDQNVRVQVLAAQGPDAPAGSPPSTGWAGRSGRGRRGGQRAGSWHSRCLRQRGNIQTHTAAQPHREVAPSTCPASYLLLGQPLRHRGEHGLGVPAVHVDEHALLLLEAQPGI